MKHLIWIAFAACLLSFTVVQQLSQSENGDRSAARFNGEKAISERNILPTTVFFSGLSAPAVLSVPEDSIPSVKLFTQTGNASYYANKFHGHRTSSGTVYHKDSLTAAHKTLKFGTVLRVTNLNNDSVVIVKVTDRMGRSSHILDLSYAGAKQLNFVRNGIAKVRIEEIKPR